MKKIFVIDWCLLLAFVLTAFSGIKLLFMANREALPDITEAHR